VSHLIVLKVQTDSRPLRGDFIKNKGERAGGGGVSGRKRWKAPLHSICQQKKKNVLTSPSRKGEGRRPPWKGVKTEKNVEGKKGRTFYAYGSKSNFRRVLELQ